MDIVRYLLNENVACESLPVDCAVRARAFDVLELLLEHGWNINEPMDRSEPSALGYFDSTNLRSLTVS
jgi:hypothetical protein